MLVIHEGVEYSQAHFALIFSCLLVRSKSRPYPSYFTHLQMKRKTSSYWISAPHRDQNGGTVDKTFCYSLLSKVLSRFILSDVLRAGSVPSVEENKLILSSETSVLVALFIKQGSDLILPPGVQSGLSNSALYPEMHQCQDANAVHGTTLHSGARSQSVDA